MEKTMTSQADSLHMIHSDVSIQDLSGSQVHNLYMAGVVYGGMGNTIINELESSGLANIMEYSKKVINSISMEKYVSTYAERAVVTNVMRSGCILIKGKSGTGKTTIGLRALAQVSEKTKWIPVVLQSPQQWDKLSVVSGENKKRQYVIMIDNIFGSTNFVQSHFDDWEKLFEIMWPLVESGQLLLIVTSRPEVFQQCEHRVSKYNMFKDAEILDLHDDRYALTAGEMKRLVKRYCGDYYTFSSSDLREISDSKLSYAIGFPLCCKFFAENEFVQQKGVTFFQNPLVGIVSELERLRESDQLGFFTLLLVLFKDSCLESKLLVPDMSKEFRSLLEEMRQFCNLDQVPTVNLLKQKVKQLCGIYLFQSNIGFHFQHQSVFDAVVLSISHDFLDRFIRVCPLGVLLEFVRLQPNQEGTTERVIYVTEDLYPTLADRMTALLISQTTSDILRHESLTDQAFAQFIFDSWSANDIIHIISLELEKRSVIVDTFNIDKVDRYYPYSDLNIMLKLTPLLKYRYLLPHLIMNKSQILQHLIPQIRNEKMKLSDAVRREAIDCAIYADSQDIITELLDQGESLSMTTLHILVMSPLREKNFIEQTFEHSEVMSKSITELADLLSFAVQSANENAVIVLVEKMKAVPKSHTIFSKCLIQLLLQSSEEMKRKPQFIPSSSRRCAIINIMRILFDAGSIYYTNQLICLASAHDDPSALIYLLDKLPSLKLSDHKSMHFHLACQYGSLKCVKELISKGTDIRVVGASNTSFRALDDRVEQSEEPQWDEDWNDDYEDDDVRGDHHYEDEDEDIFEDFLMKSNDEDISAPADFERDESPVHLNLAANSCRDSFEKVKIILFVLSKKGLLLSLKRQFQEHLPLDLLAEYEIEENNIPKVECVNNEDSHGCTPLHYAAARGNAKTLDVLIKAGANLTCVDDWGLSPLMCAVLGQNPECVRLLLNYRSFKLGREKKDILAHIVASLIGRPRTTPYLLALKHYKITSTKLYLAKLSQLFEIFHERTDDAEFVDSNGRSALMKSVQSDNMEAVKFLLSKGVNINRKDPTGRSVLHIAAKDLDFALVKLLSESGADVNLADERGRTVLYEAAGSEIDAMDKLEYLLKVRNASLVADNDGQTALFPAVGKADMEVVEYLAHNGLCVITCDKKGSSLLHIACKINNSAKIDVLKPLFDMNINIGSTNENGQNALHIACEEGILKWVQFLLSKDFPFLAQDRHGRSILHLSAASGNAELVKLVVEKEQHYPLQDKDGKTPLHIAAERNHVSVVTLLLKQKPEFNLKDFEGRTSLICAIQKRNVEVARIFINQGLNVCDQDRNGNSPLHVAVKTNCREIVQQLLTANINKSVQNNIGQTALHIAVMTNFINMVVELLEADIALDIQENEGKSALHIAVISQRISIVKLLLEKGADIDLKDTTGKTAMHCSCSLSGAGIFKLLESKGAQISTIDNNNRTTLHTAAASNNFDVAAILLDSGILTTEIDIEGNTALHVAAENGSLKTLQFILEKGGDISKKNNQGRAPLHMAAKGHHTECVNLLNDKGADSTLLDNSGMTPFELGEDCKSEASSNITVVQKFVAAHDLDSTCDEEDDDSYNGNISEDTVYDRFGELQKVTDLESIVTVPLFREGEKIGEKFHRRELMMTDKDKYGKTPLMQAVERGEYDNVQQLLANGANPSHQDNHGRTSLHLAVRKGHFPIAELLLIHHVDISLADHSGTTALDLASKLDRKEIENLILVNLCVGDQQQETRIDINNDKHQTLETPSSPPPIHEAFNYEESLSFQAMRGDVHDVRKKQTIIEVSQSPPLLHEATKSVKTFLFFAKTGDANDVRKQLEENVDILACDELGQTALHFAAMRGESDILQVLLLKQVINSSVQDHKGLTPAHVAAKHGRFIHMKLLIDNGTDLNIQDASGFTSLHYAANLGDFDMVALLLQRKCNPNIRNKYHQTALHLAAQVGNESSVECLLKSGCDVLAEDKDCKTALSLAEKNGHLRCTSLLNQYFLDSVKS